MTDIRLMNDVLVRCDGSGDTPEIEISGSSTAMAAFGQFLGNVTTSCLLEIPVSGPSPYPLSLPRIVVEIHQDETNHLTVLADETGLTIGGARNVLAKLGRSLQNFFDDDTKIGEHFHFDYYDGNPNLSGTSCSLIFACDR